MKHVGKSFLKRSLLGLLAGTAVFVCSGCNTGQKSTFKKICVVEKNLKEAFEKCHDGDIVLFIPRVYGSEQTPVIFAGIVCNYNYPVVYTTGGVSCVFTSERKEAFEEIVKKESEKSEKK